MAKKKRKGSDKHKKGPPKKPKARVTTRVSSAVNSKQPCEEELDHDQPTRRPGWKPPAGQVEQRLVRPAWSQQREQPLRGLMWCPVVAPRKPPQAPRSSQEATPAAASEPGPSTHPPAKAEPAAEPAKGKGKSQGKAANTKPPPQPGRWLDRDCNAALNMQRIGESRWRPLELCFWPDQGALPAKGKEYPGLGYKRLRDKPPKAQQQQQPAEAHALLRQGSKQQASAFAARAFGSIVPAQDSNPFLRFSSPFPKPFDHSPLLATLPETQVTTLPNGLRVATEHIPFAETTTLGVWINSGSRFETDETNGVAHFLEHILFKGTNVSGAVAYMHTFLQKRTVKELEVEVENMGGQLNAYTGREQTAYYAKVLGKDVGKAVGILSDILLNSNLDERAINKERDVILREMEEVNKQTSELVFDHLHATAFQFSPLGRTILGPVENIKSINRDQLVSYMKTHYRGPRMVLAAAGAVNHAELVKLATDAFGGIPDEDVSTSVRTLVAKVLGLAALPATLPIAEWGTAANQPSLGAMTVVLAGHCWPQDPSKFTGSYVHDRFPDATECALAVAFKGASWTDPDSIPLMVIQTMLGGWDKSSTTGKHASSKMTQTVAIENLADAYMAFNTNYHDTGLFGVYGVTDRDRCEDFAWTIMNEMTRTCYEVSEAELGRAKNQLKSSLMFFQDSTHHVAESIGRELLVYGRRLPKAELFARIDAVDAATIKAVADRFIYDQDMAIASVGDVQFMPDYNFFRRRSYWLRY
ncbi:hypothetical protein QJQ45_018206 [Haematococcus lacustris]|nr:hypothetical protein QJQ45_018206 [Haematococcus lacustris]